jgi:hypothetical protein
MLRARSVVVVLYLVTNTTKTVRSTLNVGSFHQKTGKERTCNMASEHDAVYLYEQQEELLKKITKLESRAYVLEEEIRHVLKVLEKYDLCRGLQDRLRKVVGLVVCLLLVTSARADLVFNGGTPGYSPAGNFQAGHNVTKGRVVAADFQLAEPTTITDVRFWTFEVDNNSDDGPDQDQFDGGINWFLFNNAGTSPTAQDFDGFASGRGLLTSRTQTLGQRYEYTFTLDTPVSLDTNTYWLGLELNDSPFSTGIYWVPPVGWLEPPVNTSFWGEEGRLSHASNVSGWGDTGWDFAFQLYNSSGSAVPEPSALRLVGVLSCVALAYLYWSHRMLQKP